MSRPAKFGSLALERSCVRSTLHRGQMRSLDFSSLHSLFTTLISLAVITLLGVGIRLVTQTTIQQRRERMNRQINERLRALMAAYKTLGGSFTGDLTVNPLHRRELRQPSEAAATPPLDLKVDDAHGSDRARRISELPALNPRPIPNQIRLQKPAASKCHQSHIRSGASAREQQGSSGKRRHRSAPPRDEFASALDRSTSSAHVPNKPDHLQGRKANEEGRPEGRPYLHFSVRREHYAAVTFSACQPLGPLTDIEGHSLTLLQRAEAIALDRGVVDENILTGLAAEKTKTLSIVEPLNCSLFHVRIPCRSS